MNLFALIEEENGEKIVKKIPLSGEINNQIEITFNQNYDYFFRDKEIIEFDGNYKADESELFRIRNFPMNNEILNSATNGLNYEDLDINDFTGKIKAIFTSEIIDNDTRILFQQFDTRKILANSGISLFLNGNTYSGFSKKGINIANNLTVVYQNSNIYFRSYFLAKMFLELTTYYQEATSNDVEEFMDTNIFSFEDASGFVSDLNSNQLKKIKGIQERRIIQNTTPSLLKEEANTFGIEIELSDGLINIPRDKPFVKDLIKFLDEDFFITPLTNRKCVTNSKRTI